jgi:signal transduction histidine kinase
MEVLNLACAAFLVSLDRNKIDKDQLIKGTSLSIDYLQNSKQKHSWADFTTMFNNLVEIYGKEKTINEISYLGIYNEQMTPLRKIGIGFIGLKNTYKFMAQFACQYLYKDAVIFNFREISKNIFEIEIIIKDEFEDCQILLATYSKFFEIAPESIGSPRALVNTILGHKKAKYIIQINSGNRSNFIQKFINYLARIKDGIYHSAELLKEIEAQNIKAESLLLEKSELIRIITHDIANCANSISYSLNTLNKRVEDQSESSQLITFGKTASDHLGEILRNIRDIDIADSKIIFNEKIYIESLIYEITQMMALKLNLKKVKILTDKYPLSWPLPEGDNLILKHHVFKNLIDNAIKYSDNNSVIKIEFNYNSTTNKIEILIKDTGIGISDEKKKALMIKKHQLSSKGTNGETGMGFGLGIVKTYLKLHQGELKISDNLPCGTIFTVTLNASLE